MAWPNDGEVEVRDREKHILDISKIPRQAGSKKVEAKAIKKLSEVFVVKYLLGHESVAWVSHPSVPDHPDHALAKKLLPNGRGSMIAFGIKGGKDAGVAFINNVKLASHLANVGDTRTLVIHPASGTHSQMDEATLKFAGLSHDMIRLSVGIEDIDDIKNDFEIGFRAARKPRLVSNQ